MLVLAEFEFGSVFIQRHRVSEMHDTVCRRFSEWELTREESYTGDAVPDADEVHGDVYAKGLLELCGHVPAGLGVVFVEVVGEGDLCAVVGGEEADFVDHTRETADGVGAATEA